MRRMEETVAAVRYNTSPHKPPSRPKCALGPPNTLAPANLQLIPVGRMYLNMTPHTLSRGEPLTSQLVEDSGDGFSASLTGHVHGELVLLQETGIMRS